MFDLKPYTEYTDGPPWLGAVPAHWRCLPNRAVFQEIKDQGHPEEPMLSVTITRGVIRQADLLADSSKKDSSNLDRSKYKLVQPGDIAYNKMRAWQGAAGASKHRGIVSPAYVVQRLRGDANSEYFHHLLRTPTFAKEAERWSYGITSDMWSLRPEHFKAIYSPLPPPAEQAGIVRFLGAVDRKVNRFIRAKRRLIEVLTEQKQAIITHAVTKGLNPSAPLKPSGIDWLGDVPEHWEVRKLRFLVDTLGGMTPSKADQSFWNGDVPWVSPKDMKSVEIVGSIDHITQAALAQTNITLIPSPAVLIVVRGMILARTFPVGVTTLPVTINQDMKALRPRNSPVGVNALYLRHLLSGLGDVVKMLIEESGHGTRVLRTDLWRNLPLPVPPRGEQEAICEYISNQTTVFDQAAGQARREIDLIREYRTRLVADVVTGKVDVRAAAAAIPDEAQGPGTDQGEGADDPADDDGPGAEADGDDPAEHTPEEVEA